MTEKKIVKVKIFRYDSNGPCEPRYDSYKVPVEPIMSVLNILDYIYENLDSTISYNANCRRGTCGVCTVIVNGKAVRSCIAKLAEDIIIEPISKKKCIKDLVVETL